MDGIAIRDANLADAPGILEIYAHYVECTAITFEYDAPDLAEFEGRMRARLGKYPYLVAQADGRILGYACAGSYVPRAAYDWTCETTIYVAPDFRGRGLGRMLYAELERRLGEMGIINLCACIAWVDVEDEHLDHASPDFHARMGYAKVAHFPNCGYKFGRWYDVIWMEKFLGPHGDNPPPVRFPNR